MPKMYEQFKTDARIECEGIYLDYGSFRVRIARAGGANRKFVKMLELKTKPYRRAIQTDTFSNDQALKILREVYVSTVILGWEVLQEDGTWVPGIEGVDGELLPVSHENVAKVLEDLPDLFSDIQEQSQKVALYREAILEEEAGN